MSSKESYFNKYACTHVQDSTPLPPFFSILMRASFYADQLLLLEPTTQHTKADLRDRQQIDSQ